MGEGNKNLEPTQKKLDDAREKGQIAQSQDLGHLVVLVGVVEAAFIAESQWREPIQSLMNFSFDNVGKPFMPALMESLTGAGIFLLAVFCTCFVIGIILTFLAHWGQFGILVAPEAVTPKFDKLNPVNGLKQIFSMKKLAELFQTIFRSGLIAWIVYFLTRAELNTIIHLAGATPAEIYGAFLDLLRKIFHVVMILCLCMSLIDLAIQKHFHKKELMMDQEDVKQEFKEMEGDPMVKGQRKQIAREWANEGPVAQTQNANAVVTNPTHFAVAMLYDPSQVGVPVVLAKGKDEVAQAMIRRARECGIPVIRHVWLARTLYATSKPFTMVPKSSYQAVAHVYAVVNHLLATNQVSREVELESYGEPPSRTEH